MRFWQLITTPIRMIIIAYGFVHFAIMTIRLGKWVMPRILKDGKDPLQQRKRALWIAHQRACNYIKVLHFMRIIRFEFIGKFETSSCVVVANHPSLLDFIVFLVDYPNAICLYKSQTLENPVLSSFVKVAGYIEGMDGTRNANKRILNECCQRLSEGHQVVVFPEGTRSKDAISMRRFRTTIFHAAVQSNVGVQPVAIYCDPLFLGKGQSWLSFAKITNRMVVSYLPIIKLGDLDVENRNAKGLSTAVRAAIQAELHRLDAK